MDDRRILLRKIASDTARFLLIGVAMSLGNMTTHPPGSSTFCLHWDATKFGFSLGASAAIAVLIGIIRWWMWIRAHPDALR